MLSGFVSIGRYYILIPPQKKPRGGTEGFSPAVWRGKVSSTLDSMDLAAFIGPS